MFCLTREVRFAINATPDAQLATGRATNGYAGFPSLTGLGHYFTLQVTLDGALDPGSQYLRNIKEIDEIVRRRAIPVIDARVRAKAFGAGGSVIAELFEVLRDAWPSATLRSLRLSLSPFLAYSILADEHSPERPMVRLSQKFEFSATHRLHNPELSDAANQSTFGKCNNPYGHGHNYEVQVTVAAAPGDNGRVIDVPQLERRVAELAIDRLDHKNLNAEVPEFRDAGLIPSVENIAMVIFRMLKPSFADAGPKLVSVTVWETPKTWCEYSEK